MLVCMKRQELMVWCMGSLLTCLIAVGQEKGQWRAVSSTASSITGDVAFSETRIAIDFASFPIVRVRTLESAELSSVFDVDSSGGTRGNLYRLNIPGAQKFLHKNTLCGSSDVEWLVTYVADRSLHVAFFSGSKMPLFTAEAMANSTDLCGTFLYGR